MTDIFESTARKYNGSPAVVVLFILSVAMFLIGINHFIEDTYSSKYGLEALQNAYSLKIQIFDWSYWTMSLAPQVASMVFFYMFLSDTSKRTYLILSALSQFMDFFADSWYRSNGNLFDSFGVFTISALLTFVYYSIGSEFFLTVGGGLILKLFAPAIHTWRIAVTNIKKASKGELSPSETPFKHPVGGGNNQQRKPFVPNMTPLEGGGFQPKKSNTRPINQQFREKIERNGKFSP